MVCEDVRNGCKPLFCDSTMFVSKECESSKLCTKTADRTKHWRTWVNWCRQRNAMLTVLVQPCPKEAAVGASSLQTFDIESNCGVDISVDELQIEEEHCLRRGVHDFEGVADGGEHDENITEELETVDRNAMEEEANLHDGEEEDEDDGADDDDDRISSRDYPIPEEWDRPDASRMEVMDLEKSQFQYGCSMIDVNQLFRNKQELKDTVSRWAVMSLREVFVTASSPSKYNVKCRTPVQMPEAEWNDERTRIILELFVEQVRAGNRPNTHLNNIGYRTVAAKFQQRTQLLYTKMQLKNKWDKFKSDYITWKKLLVVGAGLPWDATKGTFVADDEWWKKTNKELPGARKYRNLGLQHEDKLKVMFDYITSNGVDPSPPAPESPKNGLDHSPPAASGLPSAADSPMNGVDHSPVTANGLPLPSAPDSPINDMDHSQLATHGLPYHTQEVPINGVNLDESDHNAEDNDDIRREPVFQYTSNRRKKIPIRVSSMKKNRKNKAETALLMQSHLSRIAELAQKAQDTFEKFSSQADSQPWPSIQDVMTQVRECGARSGSNEHFIATELFVSREQREMFLTMETAEERFQWLRRKYIVKYLSTTSLGPR